MSKPDCHIKWKRFSLTFFVVLLLPGSQVAEEEEPNSNFIASSEINAQSISGVHKACVHVSFGAACFHRTTSDMPLIGDLARPITAAQ